MNEPKRKGEEYKDGELDVILSLIPTNQNIVNLARLLDRSPSAIQIVYRLAYDKGPFGQDAETQRMKIEQAKVRLGINIHGSLSNS